MTEYHPDPSGAAAPISVPEAQRQTARRIEEALRSTPDPIADLTGHLARAPGKGARALLLLYAAADESGLVPQDTVLAAAAVELFHLATLVHDDVIDDAPLRRGIASVQHRFGRKQAVLCGDYLLCLAASLIEPLRTGYQEYAGLFSTLTAALGRVCLGELSQLQSLGNVDLGVPGYLRTVAGKTASLFYASAMAGALIARHSEREVMRLARFGRYFGMVFQIIDDCKDYELSEREAQKPVGCDLAEGVITLPLIYAVAGEPRLAALAREAIDDAAAAKGLARAVCEAGGTQRARALAARYADKAAALLQPFPAAKTGPLMALLEKGLHASTAF